MEKVSVITIVKNHKLGLRSTYVSLKSQSFSDWEMYIVHGPSSDGTENYARGLAASDSRIHAIEQQSIGIYTAMNEGISAATGEFIWFMNAGDCFADDGILNRAVLEMAQLEVGLLVGGYKILDGVGRRSYSFSRKVVTPFSFAFNRRGGCHQAMLFRTSTLKSLGGFDISYSLASDFDLVIKIMKESGAHRVDEIYATVEPGGVADLGLFQVYKEKHDIRRLHFHSPFIGLLSAAWTFAASSKIFLKRIIGH